MSTHPEHPQPLQKAFKEENQSPEKRIMEAKVKEYTEKIQSITQEIFQWQNVGRPSVVKEIQGLRKTDPELANEKQKELRELEDKHSANIMERQSLERKVTSTKTEYKKFVLKKYGEKGR